MMETALLALTEDELNTLVSIAIRRAEVSDDVNSPTASDAWHEVMVYEERIASITRPEEITGGIARVGAVRAALAAGQRLEAARLASSSDGAGIRTGSGTPRPAFFGPRQNGPSCRA
jgi:hypothetical protein